jgi:hypothetical protein
MSKNQKPIKINDTKNSSAKTASTEEINTKDQASKVTGAESNKKWDSMLNCSAESIKENMQNLLNHGIGSLCGSSKNNNCKTTVINDMMTKLSGNVRHNFEQNMELSQDVLKCKTAADFIEFQRNHFEINYKNTVKLLNDLFYDMRELVTQSSNDKAD